MIRGDEQWLGVADAFATAALDGDWESALTALADACGSRSGQLVGFGSDTVTFNYWTGVDPELVAEFAAVDGGNPAVNPRVRAAVTVPELTVLAEEDFLTPEEYRSNAIYTWGKSRGLAFSCISPLIHSADSLVGLAVIRTERQGHIEAPERAVFTSLAPHARAAVRTHMLLEGQALALLGGTLEALSVAAFVCDARGKVVRHTALAEARLADGRLRLQHGRLSAVSEASAGLLQDAIAAVAAEPDEPAPPRHKTVLLGAARDADPLMLDVIGLPRCAGDFTARPRVVVVVRGHRGEAADLTEVLRAAWGLTEAEARVAVMLAQGASSAAIAEKREVTVGTVRIQTKSIFAKLGVNRQAELAARLQPLL